METEKDFEDYIFRYNKQLYAIGESVYTCVSGCMGGEILEVYENTFYLVKYKHREQIPYSRKYKVVEDQRWFIEYELSKVSQGKDMEFTRKRNWKDTLFMSSNKKPVESWLNMYVKKGLQKDKYLDLNPSYQRDLVWTLEAKQSLIDSIFNLKHTGNLIVIENNYDYEVLDGKQRLSTVFEFINNEFQYKGKYYKDLSILDKRTIKNHYFHYTQISGEFTEQQKVELFIDFNTTGTQVDLSFIEDLKSKYFNKQGGKI